MLRKSIPGRVVSETSATCHIFLPVQKTFEYLWCVPKQVSCFSVNALCDLWLHAYRGWYNGSSGFAAICNHAGMIGCHLLPCYPTMLHVDFGAGRIHHCLVFQSGPVSTRHSWLSCETESWYERDSAGFDGTLALNLSILWRECNSISEIGLVDGCIVVCFYASLLALLCDCCAALTNGKAWYQSLPESKVNDFKEDFTCFRMLKMWKIMSEVKLGSSF